MTKNKNKKSSEAAKQEAFKLSDGICYCKTPVIDFYIDCWYYKPIKIRKYGKAKYRFCLTFADKIG